MVLRSQQSTYVHPVTGKAKGTPKLEAMIIEDKLGGTTRSAAMTREEYENKKESYTEEAKRLGRKIGAGVNDGSGPRRGRPWLPKMI
jgi:hypothetical protein